MQLMFPSLNGSSRRFQMFLISIIQGFLLGASLIIAIGPQNAFVINQGLKRQHVFITALIFSLSDAILISAGVFGIGDFFNSHPLLIEIARWFGALFLAGYGILSFRAAFHPAVLKLKALSKPTLNVKKVIILSASLSFLNPHAYLDTVVLIGTVAAQHEDITRPLFGIGAILASFVWFFSIAYGAKTLTPLFKKAFAWRILDITTGCIMWIIALMLVFYH